MKCRNLPGCACFEGMKRSRRTTVEAWLCERPREFGRGDAGSVAIESLGLAGSWRKAEALYTWKVRVPEESSGEVNVQLSCSGGPAFWRCWYHVMTTKDSHPCSVELA